MIDVALADFSHVVRDKLLYRGKCPKFVGLSSLLSQTDGSCFNLEVVPVGDCEVATQFFAAGASVNIKTDAKVYGAIKLETTRPCGAVGGSLAVAIRAAIEGDFLFEDRTKAGLCVKHIVVSALQRAPLHIRVEEGVNLLSHLDVDVRDKDVLVSGRFHSISCNSVVVTDERKMLERENSGGQSLQTTRVITIRLPLPENVT